MKSMPRGWEPPVDAWQAEFDDDVSEVVFAYFGAQRPKGSASSQMVRRFADSQGELNGPLFVSRAEMVDGVGYQTDMMIAYWHSREAYDAWWEQSGFAKWWQEDTRVNESSGYFREIFIVAPARFETLYSSRNPTGSGALGEPLGEPVREHNYWGGMRDRVHASSQEDFASPIGSTLPKAELIASRRRRISAGVSDNLCLIRSGQNWSACGEEELETYLDLVRPKLTAGMAFLRDNPQETGCISCRLMDETNLDGTPADQSFGLGLFLSMKHLEDWSKSHPTHLAIFNSFFEMIESRGGSIDLQLWHEVLVADAKNSVLEYVNCHPNTGMLPYLALADHSLS